jgi:hypothetical protein
MKNVNYREGMFVRVIGGSHQELLGSTGKVLRIEGLTDETKKTGEFLLHTLFAAVEDGKEIKIALRPKNVQEIS